MRLTSFSNRDLKKEGQSTSQGIFHDFTMTNTDDGVAVTAKLRQSGPNSDTPTFEADDFYDAIDYAEAFERALTRELATTGIHGYTARMSGHKAQMIGQNFTTFGKDGKVPDQMNRYSKMDTRVEGEDGTHITIKEALHESPVPYEIPQHTLDRLTYQADQAARDGLLSERESLRNDEAAQVISRFLERSGIGAGPDEPVDEYAKTKIALPLLGKDTHIELTMDDKANRVWRLHDKQLEAAHKENSAAVYNPPEGPLNVASLYDLGQKLEDMAMERGVTPWPEERYYRDMVRAASDLKCDANAITNPNHKLTLPGEEPAAPKAQATPGLEIKVGIGRAPG